MTWLMNLSSLHTTLKVVALMAAQFVRHASSATHPTLAQSCRRSSHFRTSSLASWIRSTITRRCRLTIRLTWLRTNSEKPSTWTEHHQRTERLQSCEAKEGDAEQDARWKISNKKKHALSQRLCVFLNALHPRTKTNQFTPAWPLYLPLRGSAASLISFPTLFNDVK